MRIALAMMCALLWMMMPSSDSAPLVPRVTLQKRLLIFGADFDESLGRTSTPDRWMPICGKIGGCDVIIGVTTKQGAIFWTKANFNGAGRTHPTNTIEASGWRIQLGADRDSKMGSDEVAKADLKVLTGRGYLEHTTAMDFESLQIGSLIRAEPVDQIFYKPGDPQKQNFARSQTGFALVEISKDFLSVRFFDLEAREIYRWQARSKQVGLRRLLDPGLSADPSQAIARNN